MCVYTKQLQQHGRNYGLYNDSVRQVLFLVGQSPYPLSLGEIAALIRKDEEKKMSNEYKIVKRLCPPVSSIINVNNPRIRRYLDIVKRDDGSDGYFLNFRGLLVYLFNEYIIQKKESVDYTKKSERERHIYRKHIVNSNTRFNSKIVNRINKVISNPLVIEKAKFLTNWEVFQKQGFDVIGLLLDIGVELQNQLSIDSYDDTYLIRRATERYFIILENFYEEFEFSISFNTNITKFGELKSLRETMNNYRKLILSLTKEFISKEFKRLDYIDNLSSSFEILKALDKQSTSKTKIISLIPLMSKYKNKFKNSITFLDTIKNARNYPEYIFADNYLISKTLLQKIKSPLLESMKFSHLVPIFRNCNIPQSCIHDVMEYLGYEVKASKFNNDDDFEKGSYITFTKKDIRYMELYKKSTKTSGIK